MGFTDRMLAKIEDEYFIDPNRIFGIGFSQGGLFVNRLACERSEVFAGIAVVAATFSVPLSESCDPNFSTSYLLIQGTRDRVLSFEGSDNGALSLLSAQATIDEWVSHNNCSGSPEISSETHDFEYEITRYSNCRDNRHVQLIAIQNAGHIWPTDAEEHIGQFFSQLKVAHLPEW